MIPDTLVGSTSLKLRNVTWDQVFKVILEPIGFTYIQERNIIKIKSNEDLLQEPTATRVFVIDFATALTALSAEYGIGITGTPVLFTIEHEDYERSFHVTDMSELIFE